MKMEKNTTRFNFKNFYCSDNEVRKEMIGILVYAILIYAQFKIGHILYQIQYVTHTNIIIGILLIFTGIIFFSKKIHVR